MEMQQIVVGSAAGTANEGVHPLTWGQTNMWSAVWGYRDEAWRLNLRRTFVPRERPALADACRSLAILLSRLDILRTTFGVSPRQQQVAGDAEVAVDLLTLDGQQALDAAGSAHNLAARLAAEPFEHSGEVPVRIGLVREGDDVAAVALVVSHLAFDAAGANLLRDLVAAVVAGAPAEGSAPLLQACELAALEHGEPLRLRSERSIQGWLETMRAMQPGPGIRPPRAGAYTTAELRSSAVAIAAEVIASRTRTSSSTVILAALSAAVARHCDDAPPAIQLICSNRHYSEIAGYIGLALQNALFAVPPQATGDAMNELVIATHREAMSAHMKARYDTARLHELVADAGQRGEAADLSFFFNDARNDPNAWAGLGSEADALARIAADEPEPDVVGRCRFHDCTLFFNLLPAGRSCSMQLTCDDNVIPPEISLKILHEMRRTLVFAALERPSPVASL